MSERSDAGALDRAYEAGKWVGRRSEAGPELCPFTRDTLDLRIAWLDGFADGRWEATRRRHGPGGSSPFFGSGIACVVPLPHRI